MLFAAAALAPSIEIGKALTPPAAVAGAWEARVSDTEVAGLSLQVTTNADQTVRSINVRTYVRKDGISKYTWWSDIAPGDFTLRGGVMHFHETPSTGRPFDVTLDLTYDPSRNAWAGSFADPFYAGAVDLRRPAFDVADTPAGMWRTYSAVEMTKAGPMPSYACDTIGVGADGAFVIWGETSRIALGLEGDGTFAYGSDFGEVRDDAKASNVAGLWAFTVGSSLSGDRVSGRVVDDGAGFAGTQEHYGNGISDPAHPVRPLSWTRMRDFTCHP